MDEPILTEKRMKTLDQLNQKKPIEYDKVEQSIGPKLSYLEQQLQFQKKTLFELERKMVEIRSNIQRTCGAFEILVDLLSEHYTNDVNNQSHGRPISNEEITKNT